MSRRPARPRPVTPPPGPPNPLPTVIGTLTLIAFLSILVIGSAVFFLLLLLSAS